MTGKRRITILGGGVGAIATACALTDPLNPNHDQYEVTVYQLGWRLGGKGTSSRNADAHFRIQEHGIHVWFGFYYNAVTMMRRCCRELADATGEPDAWAQTFVPHDSVVLEDHEDGWEHLQLSFPPHLAPSLPTPTDYVHLILQWLVETCRASAALAGPAQATGSVDAHHRAAASEWLQRVELAGRAAIESPIDLLGSVARHARGLLDGACAGAASALPAILAVLRSWVASRLYPDATLDPRARQLWMFVDLGCAIVRGMLCDGVLLHGFDHIDHEDLWAWLSRHGAHRSHQDCALIRALYGMSFSFEGGQLDRRSLGAGTTLRALLRMVFAYGDTFMWKMRAGMGDAVFAPLYRLLRARGVRFEFFHRVRALHLSADGRSIERITLGRQVRLRPGLPDGAYWPLIAVPDANVGERWCWPHEPRYDDLHPDDVAKIRALQNAGQHVDFESHWSAWGPQNEAEVRLDLRKDGSGDFDDVVLGISIGAFPVICRELIEADARWARMVDRVQTVRTQAFQLWLKPSLRELGWALKDGPVSTAYVPPVDTWADMSQTLAAEPWPGAASPRFVAYFCGVLSNDPPDPPWFTQPGFPAERARDVYDNMRRFLSSSATHLWPRSWDARRRDFDWELLVAPSADVGPARLKAQFWIANIDPSERYVLSLPGTTFDRLWSDESGFENLYLAGDWTRNVLNVGCVEATVTSALRASRAISGYPQYIIGEHDV